LDLWVVDEALFVAPPGMTVICGTTDGWSRRIVLKKSENELAQNSRICPARGVEDAGWLREPMTLVAETD
jgi:hypothetical protein